MNPDPDADRERDPCPFPREEIPEDLLAWVRQTFDPEEFLAEVRESRKTGCFQLEDFIDELEALARPK